MNTKNSTLVTVLPLLLLGLTLLVWTSDLTATAQEAEVNTHIPMASNISNAESFWKLDNQSVSGWPIETVDSSGDVGYYPSLALDMQGYPHIVYYDATNNDLKYAYKDASGWHILIVDSAGKYPSLALDESSTPHISYFDAVNYTLQYARYESTGWFSETVDTGLGPYGGYPSLALDGSGQPHISYLDWATYDLMYTYKNITGWVIETVDSNGYVGSDSSIALDENDLPHIGYRNYTGYDDDLKYAYRDSEGWHTQTLDSEGLVGRSLSLALDRSGHPHISYYDATNGDLKYAYQDTTGWHLQVIISAGDVGHASSLALDDNDYPHISHYDTVNGDLLYAYRDAAGWHTQVLDSGGNTGRFSSLVLDETNYPHISYYDLTNGDLKYAYSAPLLAVTKTSDTDLVQAGAQLTYTLHVTNTGSVDLHATVTDTLPAYVTPSGILTWTPTITAPGGIWMAQYVVSIEMGYAGPLTNVVQVTTVEGATGTYTATLHAQVRPELNVTKRADTDLVLPGDPLTYTLVVSNTGNVTLTATITDVLPLNVTLGETSGGSVFLPPGWIVWSPVTLAPGDIWAKSIVVIVTMEAAGSLTNTVQVVTEEGAWGTDTVIVAVEESITGLAAHNNSPTQLGDLTILTATVAAGSNVVYLWDFGDGEMGSGDVVSHTYSNVWTYTAVVTASNSFTVMTATSTIRITDAPVVGLSATNDSPTPLGRSTTLTATVMAGSNVTYTWAFGDDEISYGKVVSHSYPAQGTYTAVVTASNSANFITATTPVKIMACVYLPVILKRWPPIPYQPTLYAINNADGDGNYTVSWTEQPARLADTYILEEATSATFTIGLRTVCTTAEQTCAVSGRVAGTYYYRVKGQNVWDESAWSNTQTAGVLLPATPVLNAINNADGDGSYTVSWNAAARATSYVLQEDTSSTFNNPTTVFNGAQTSWSASGKAVGTYYYRVIANGPTGQSGWSATQSVSVRPPDAPYLNPISNADGDGNYNVTWGVVPGATSYTLQEDDNTAFNSPQTLYTGANQSWSATNHAQGTYYYRAAAIGSTGQSAWSNSQSVTIFPPANVRITYINYDPPGDDVAGEYVNIVNSGGRAQVMTSWTLRDIASHVFTFPSFTLAAGATVKVWTKGGTNTATDLYWGSSQAIWNNDGDTAYLRDAGGALVSSYTYP